MWSGEQTVYQCWEDLEYNGLEEPTGTDQEDNEVNGSQLWDKYYSNRNESKSSPMS